MLLNDTLFRVLYVDVSKRSFHIKERPDLFQKYIGGTGVAIQLLSEECPEDYDPLGPDNPIIFAAGALTSLFPLASKTVAMFKSPHTGNLGESHCGGRSAVSIRLAGYGAIVIKGKSDIPIYLSISEGKVVFKNATTIWGMGSQGTVGKILRENETLPGMRTIMRIGRAGENLISYACVTTESYRHFGRLGLGAVFGSKLLKAVVVSGHRSFEVEDKKSYKSLYDEIYDLAVKSKTMKKYHELGTPENVIPLNRLNGLPTRNLQSARFEYAEDISGEAFADNFLAKRLACAHCPVGCIHLAELKEPYENDPYFYKKSTICYDYELIYALGSLLGGSNSVGILKLIDKIEAVGLDAMSTGVILAWITEAFSKQLISEKETSGLTPDWNNYDTYILMIDNMVEPVNEFYKALGKGVMNAASLYGGMEYALSFAGNEMPGYHTGPGSHLGYMIGARHSHLDNAGYSIDQKVLLNEHISPESLAEKIIEEECQRQILTSLPICLFARGIYSEENICRALQIAGIPKTPEELRSLGKEIYGAKYQFKFKHGFSWSKTIFPKRIFETESTTGMIQESYLNQAFSHAKSQIEQALPNS